MLTLSGNLRIKIPMVDVRDVAEAHVRALKSSEVVNKRHILVSHQLWSQEVAGFLKIEFGKDGHSLLILTLPNFICRLGSFFFPILARMVNMLDREWKCDNTKVSPEMFLIPLLIGRSISLQFRSPFVLEFLKIA